MNTKPIRLLAVASVPESKAAIQSILGELKDSFLGELEGLEIVGIAYNKRVAIQQANNTQPDVLLIDLMLLGLRSIEVISYVSATQPDCKILALCPGDPPHEHVILAIQAGALGYVCKDAEPSQFHAAIQTVLRGEYYLPLAETYDVLQQAAPELLVSAKERRTRLVQVMLGLIPVAGIIGAFTEFLWREYWGTIGVRVADLGVNPSSRVAEFLISLLMLLGAFGPLLFVNVWRRMINGWINDRPRLRTIIASAQGIKVGRLPIGWLLFGAWTGWFALALVAVAIMVPLGMFGGKILCLLVGAVIGAVLLAHMVGSSHQLPGFLTLPTGEGARTFVIVGVFLLVLMWGLSAEVFFVGPDLRTDGLHGFLVTRMLDVSARPVMIYDLDERHEPLGALYLGGNADLYVLYDPCKRAVRFIPVGSSRVEFVNEVQCPPQSYAAEFDDA